MRALNKVFTSTMDTIMVLKQYAAAGLTFYAVTKSESSSVCDSFAKPILQTSQGSTWNLLKNAVWIGGTAIVCSYIGYRFWDHLVQNQRLSKAEAKARAKAEAKAAAEQSEAEAAAEEYTTTVAAEIEAEFAANADDFKYLPEGTLWCDVAGDEWASADMPVDPVYGLPPWLARMKSENPEKTDLLSPEPEYNIPMGATWADLCPEEIEEVEIEAVYQLPSEEEEKEEVEKEEVMTRWGLKVISEEE